MSTQIYYIIVNISYNCVKTFQLIVHAEIDTPLPFRPKNNQHCSPLVESGLVVLAFRCTPTPHSQNWHLVAATEVAVCILLECILVLWSIFTGQGGHYVTRWIVITYLIHPAKSLVLSSFMVVVDWSKSTTCLHFHTLIYSNYDIVKRFPHTYVTLNNSFTNVIIPSQRLVTMSVSLCTQTVLRCLNIQVLNIKSLLPNCLI